MKIETLYEANLIHDELRKKTMLTSRDKISIDVDHIDCCRDALRLMLSPETLEAIETKKDEIRDLIISDLTNQCEALKVQLEAL